ncbi:hypothetical protein Emag_007188 [Eimeria magna]
MTVQPDPTRTPYEHTVAILIQQVAPGKPGDYLHQTIALIARRTDTQISLLHMQFTEAYDAYRDLCARLRSPPRLGGTPRASHPPTRRHQRTARTPSELLQKPPPAPCAAAIHDLNQQAPRAPPQPSALSSPVAITRPPAPRWAPASSATFQTMGTVSAPLTCGRASTTPHSPPSARHAVHLGSAPCHARAASTSSAAPVSPIWRSTVLAHERPAPQAPQQPAVALIQLHSGAADAAPTPPANTDPRPTTPPPADPPAAQGAVFCAAPPAPSAPATPPAICNHTRLGTPPRAPKSPTHKRAWVTIDGVRCEVIIDTGASLSLISADVLRPHRSYQPWAPVHDSVTGVNNHTLPVLGHVALEVRLGPLKTTARFFVVPGVAFAALLGVDFLYEHAIAVSLARHALIFEGHGGQVFPLLGHHPRLAPLCALAQDVALHPGSTAWVRTTLAVPATAPASPLVYLVAASTLPGVGLAIPEELTSGLIAIRTTSDRPLHLSAGLPLAKAVRLPPAAIHSVRLIATDSAPSPVDGAADTPSYEKIPGGFIPTLPSPNNCLLPAELQQLRDPIHEFRDRFNDGSEPLPATSLLKARLDTGDAQPISTPPRRLSPAMRQAVREAVAELDAQGLAEPSTGCWSTPIVMVRKASGAWRLCCDYRAINEQVRIPQQPLPRTDDILASFNNKKYFLVLDMCKGFDVV